MSDVVFLQMPFAGLERPSLALGLFTASLREAKIPVETIQANLAFAEKIGLLAFVLVRSSSPGALLGEWLFSESAFGAASQRPPETALDRNTFELPDEAIDFVLGESGHAGLEALFLDLRRQATQLISELAQAVVERSPKAVACTSMFDQHVASLALLRRVKALDPRILTVIGGANCAGSMGRATHSSFPFLDFTVTGEFDPFVADFFRRLAGAKGEAANVGPLPPNTLGPEDRTEGGEEKPGSPAAILTEMDRAAVPDYSDYFERLYSSPLSRYIRPSLPIETSRGCWWGAKQHCTFCGLNAEGMAFRKKTPARALEEIRTLTSRHNVFRLAAADNIIDMSYFQSVLPALASDGKAYNLFYETKGNLKREQIQAFAEAGCNFIQPGIESLHDETLKIMRKGITACMNIQTLKHCLELGVFPEWNILCGFPGSDPAWLSEVAAQLPMLSHLPPANGVFPIRFDRFSPYHQNPEDHGLSLEPLPSYRKVYPLGDAVLKDLAYFFRQTGGFPQGVLESARAASEAAKRWAGEFWSASRPKLEIEQDDGEILRIRDTRSCATAGSHILAGGLAALLRALESPATLKGALARLQEPGGPVIDEGEVAAGLDELAARRLIWRSSTQSVALPTPPPKRPMPGKADPAVGRVDLARYIVEKVRFKLAFA
jgi:magnesium-protoporphyrin IX monomethyl ester (oxidative) cyclase